MSGHEYRWPFASDWLADKVQDHASAGNVAELVSLIGALSAAVDEDQIQDLFQSEMDRDGFFRPVRRRAGK